MRIKLIITGKTSESYINVGMKEYVKRLSHYVPLELIFTEEIKKSSKTPDPQLQTQREGDMLFKLIKPGDYLILLDEKGKEYTSEHFAVNLQKLMGTLQHNLVFAIGGAYGFDERIYKRANMLLSLSKMTFSHQMVRLFFLEQLYRAMTINKNQPYHHR